MPPSRASDREIVAAGPRPEPEALRRAYLDLLKLCLCDLAGPTTSQVMWTDDRRVFSRVLTDEIQLGWRADGSDWPLNGLTMIGLTRLDDLQSCVESIVADGVEGDLIETGTWRGGASILMRATLNALGAFERMVCVADSFQGFPMPEDEGDDRDLEFHMSAIDFLAPTVEDVRGYFARFGLLDGVEFIPGFFEETLGRLRGRRWSLVRLDADSYQATRLALEMLYPSLSPGGYLVVDDYNHPYLPVCRRAVDDFREAHGLTEPLERVDWTAVRWRRVDDGSGFDLAPADPPAVAPRAAATRTGRPVPTDRELQLQDEVAELRERVRALEEQLEESTGRRSRLL